MKDLAEFDGAWTVSLRIGQPRPSLITSSLYRCGKVSSLRVPSFYQCTHYVSAGLMDDIAAKVYEAMAFHVTQANFNRRVKAVSAWSLQMTASAILSALRSAMDPMAAHLKQIYEEGLMYELQLPASTPLP